MAEKRWLSRFLACAARLADRECSSDPCGDARK